MKIAENCLLAKARKQVSLLRVHIAGSSAVFSRGADRTEERTKQTTLVSVLYALSLYAFMSMGDSTLQHPDCSMGSRAAKIKAGITPVFQLYLLTA